MPITYAGIRIFSSDATALMRRINAIEDFTILGASYTLFPSAYGDERIWGDLTITGGAGGNFVGSAHPTTGAIDTSITQPFVYNGGLFGETQETLYTLPYLADYADPLDWELITDTAVSETISLHGVIGYAGHIYILAINPPSENFDGLYIFKFDYEFNKIASILVAVGTYTVDSFLVYSDEVIIHHLRGTTTAFRYVIDIDFIQASVVVDTRRDSIRGGVSTFMSPANDGTFFGVNTGGVAVHVGNDGDIIYTYPAVGSIVFTDGTDIIIAASSTARTYTISGTLVRTVTFSSSGDFQHPQTTFYRYPNRGAATNKQSLGTPDGGASVPASGALLTLNSGERHRPHARELINMRNALESVCVHYKNGATGNAFTLSADADNIFRVAIDAGQDDWTRPTVTSTVNGNTTSRMKATDMSDIDLVLIELEASDLV